MTPNSRSSNDKWTLGEGDIVEFAKSLLRFGADGAILHISTSAQSMTSLQLPVEDENRLLYEAWSIACAKMPDASRGKRWSWRSYIFLMELSKEESVAIGKEILGAYQKHRELSRLVWRFVLTHCCPQWEVAFKLVEADSHEYLKNAKENMIVWVDGSLELPVLIAV